jgi:thiopurine S-methyltransferase
MNHDFWRGRWADGQIGFHQGRPNLFLERHHAVLGEKKRVFVPLCGKTVDLVFLAAQGHEVVGVELVEDAVKAFFAEQQLTPTVTSQGPLTGYQAGAITIFAGDYFHATRAVLGAVNAVYDRAALIALPPDLRTRYVSHLRKVVPEGNPGLVVTLEYPQAEAEGPPFSVPEAELRTHYAGATVELLEQGPADGRFAVFAERARECCWSVRL